MSQQRKSPSPSPSPVSVCALARSLAHLTSPHPRSPARPPAQTLRPSWRASAADSSAQPWLAWSPARPRAVWLPCNERNGPGRRRTPATVVSLCLAGQRPEPLGASRGRGASRCGGATGGLAAPGLLSAHPARCASQSMPCSMHAELLVCHAPARNLLFLGPAPPNSPKKPFFYLQPTSPAMPLSLCQCCPLSSLPRL